MSGLQQIMELALDLVMNNLSSVLQTSNEVVHQKI